MKKKFSKTYTVYIKSMVHDILHNAEVRKKYPNLYLEVFEQSQTIVGERFILSEEAFDEWQTYRNEY